jgi:hypothetical protein
MRQRVPPGWVSSNRAQHVPRLLVEARDDALALSDFSRFHQAGFEVAWCSGPSGSSEECAVLRNEDCPLLRGADVVLHALDPDTGVARAIRTRHPKTALVQIVPTAEKDGGEDGALCGHRSGPDRVLSGTDCVETQIRAVRLALSRRCAIEPDPSVDGQRTNEEPAETQSG